MPSYWWKRIFGLVVDEVEDVRKVANSKANKSVVDEVDALSKRVDTIINSGNNIFPDMPSNAMSLIQSVEAGTFEPRASGGSATTSYKIYKDLNAFIAVIGSRLYIYDLAAGDFKGVTFLGGIYLQTNNELTKLSNAIHYNLVLGDWILGADCFMLDANTGDSYGVTYGNGSVFSFTYEKNGYEYTDRLNPDGTLENISFNKPKSTPTFLLYYPYTTRNDVYTMHESFIEHNATELPKIKNSINNKEGYILNVVAAGTSATDVQTMQDVDFHYLGYGTGNTGGLVVITSQFIPIYRAVQPNRLFLGFKEDGSCEVKEIAVGDTLYLYYSEDYGFNFTDAEKAANAENIIPIWNSLDESFTPRPIIIRHKVNDTPTGSGNYLSIPAVLTGVDTTGTNIILVGCFSPGRFLEYQYNGTTGEFVSLKEITIEGGEGSSNEGLFIAVYNETSLEEIQEAFSKKMTCVCLYVGNYYLLSEKTDNKAIFRGFNGDKEYYQLTRTTKQWLASSSQYESTMNKTQSISENSTSTQYPSAKAVYEALQNVGGGEGSYDDTGIKKDIADLQAKDTQHDAKLAELSAEVGNKVDADFVNNAIATAVTNELNADF